MRDEIDQNEIYQEESGFEKEELLADIDRLLDYNKSGKSTIDPSLLQYLDFEALRSIKEGLLARVGTLTDEDKAWLEQFKKYD